MSILLRFSQDEVCFALGIGNKNYDKQWLDFLVNLTNDLVLLDDKITSLRECLMISETS